MKKIAIVGAGLSGLLLSDALTRRGLHCTLFEKARGVGGRLTTRRLPWGHLDLGAQYFTARSTHFQQAVAEWQRAGCVAPWNFVPHKLTTEGLRLSPDQLDNSGSLVRYVGVPDMNSLARYLARAAELRLQTRIERIERQDGAQGWSLFTDDAQHYSDFDALLLTLPAEQTRPLLSGVSSLADRLPAAPHTPCWALALATQGQVDPAIEGVFGDEVVSWLARQSSKPQRKVMGKYDDLWLLHFSPAWSQAHGKDYLEQLPAMGLNWLQAALNSELTLLHHYAHYWRYANIEPTAQAEPFYLDRDNQVAVVGAWCCGGKVEGAFESVSALLASGWLD